jgi:hypothetical protein
VSNQTKLAYKYRFYPTALQKIILAQTFGCVRFVYNWGLSMRKTAYFQRGQSLSYNDLAAMLPALKEQYPWLAAASSVPLQQALWHLDRTFVNFFEGRAEYLTFKKKRHEQSATYAANAFRWDGTTLTLAKMDAPLHIVWHRTLPKGCKPSSVTITKDSANRYFVSLLTKFNRVTRGLPKTHWCDAACVGKRTPERLTVKGVVPLQIAATRHGSRQMCRMDKYGFPRTDPKQHKRVKGFQTGDLVRAVVTSGTKQGTYMGKMAVRTSGSFNITTRHGTTQGISHRCCELVARSDGYTYVQGKERALPPTA